MPDDQFIFLVAYSEIRTKDPGRLQVISVFTHDIFCFLNKDISSFPDEKL